MGAWEYSKSVLSFSNLEDTWAESFGFLGLLIALLIGVSSVIAGHPYIIALLLGLFFGRWVYRNKRDAPSITAVVLTGIGLVIGTILVDTLSIIVLYAGGLALAYAAHERKIIQSVDV